MPRIFKKPYLSFASHELHSYLLDLELQYECGEETATTGANECEVSFPSLKKWRVRGKCAQSFVAGELESLMFPLLGSETPSAVIVRPSQTARGSGNPEYTGSGYLVKFPPMSGSMGKMHTVDFEIAPATDLARSVTT